MPQVSMQRNAPKPTSVVKLTLGSIPKTLKHINRWILWKYTWIARTDGSGKWSKVPHGLAGHKIDATDFANGGTFTEAVQALKARKAHFDGLGFLLGDGIAGIDVDDCIDEDGNLNERGAAISAQYAGTYAEVSPSARGFKILVDISSDPKLAVIGKHTKEIEIYGGRRYFTVTGAKLPGHADTVAPMAQAFAATAAAVGVAARLPQPVADIPAEQQKRKLGVDMAAARELLDHLPFRWCDEYGDWLRAGMAMHHEFNGSTEALALWDEWSQRAPEQYDEGACSRKWLTFGKPGKEFVTMRTIVRDAQATGWRAPSTIERAVQDFKPFEEPQDAGDIDDATGAVKPNWWQKHSVGDMLSQPAPDKEWIWPGVLRQGKLMVLGGSGGSSKSYLMLAASVQYALGNDWGPFEQALGVDPGKVLLLYGEEDRADVHDRVQALKVVFMLTDEQVSTVANRVAVLPLRGTQIELVRQNNVTNDIEVTQQLQRLEQRIEEYDVRLVVMDPLALLHNLEENDNHAIAAFVSGLDAVCMRRNCSIVLVHHFAKGGAMTAREVNEQNLRGASALVAHARTVVVMHRLREDEARSWGVPEEDHARWVMWAIAKNNYGPSGRRFWFVVNEHTGAITPAPTQLQYMNTADIREAAQAHAAEIMHADITAAEERRLQDAAMEDIRHNRRMQYLLRHAQEHEGNVLPRRTRAVEILTQSGIEGTARRARAAFDAVRDARLVDTDGLINEAGLVWLDGQSLLE